MRHKSLIGAALAVMFLAACGSTGIDDVLGGGNSPSNTSAYEIRGTVDSVDTNSRSIWLTNVSGTNQSMLSNSGSGNTVRIYYDDQTTVDFNGQSYRPENLERGDQVAARVGETNNNTLFADRMTVLHDVSGNNNSGSFPNTGSYGSTVRGIVTYVDASRRTIEIDRTSGANVVVEYGTNTPVYFDGNTYRVGDLERGDEIEIRVSDLGSGRYSAQDVTVLRNVSGGGFGTSQGQTSTIRGTVVSIDTVRRTIELESASWISGFNSGAGSGMGSRMTLYYDANTSIDVSGSLQPLSGLERGDVIEAQVRASGNNAYTISRAFLVRDVRR